MKEIHKFTNSQIHKFYNLFFFFLFLSATTFGQTSSASGYDWLIKGGIYNTGGYPATLDVGSTGYGTGGSISIVAGNGSSTGAPGNINFTIANVPTSGLIKFGTNASINYTGNFITNGTVSIGTSTIRSGCMLTVAGKIAAQEFEIVTNVNAPDYVFENNYKLRSLKELENYISRIKHLPDVPGAKQFKQDGYKVAEMDNLLLKKIEELTLYTIALNKEVEVLKAELAKGGK